MLNLYFKVIWPKYCRYGVKLDIINQSLLNLISCDVSCDFSASLPCVDRREENLSGVLHSSEIENFHPIPPEMFYVQAYLRGNYIPLSSVLTH